MKLAKNYPIRTCYSVHECHICNKNITLGEKYEDGGDKKAHLSCIEELKTALYEPDQVDEEGDTNGEQ